jgi:hypothetical protein
MGKKVSKGNTTIKAAMRMWERRVRDAVRRASARGELWYFRGWFDHDRRDYWSAHYGAHKAAERLEKRGTIRFMRLRASKRHRGGYVAKGYTLNPGRTKVVKATKRKARK